MVFSPSSGDECLSLHGIKAKKEKKMKTVLPKIKRVLLFPFRVLFYPFRLLNRLNRRRPVYAFIFTFLSGVIMLAVTFGLQRLVLFPGVQFMLHLASYGGQPYFVWQLG